MKNRKYAFYTFKYLKLGIMNVFFIENISLEPTFPIYSYFFITNENFPNIKNILNFFFFSSWNCYEETARFLFKKILFFLLEPPIYRSRIFWCLNRFINTLLMGIQEDIKKFQVKLSWLIVKKIFIIQAFSLFIKIRIFFCFLILLNNFCLFFILERNIFLCIKKTYRKLINVRYWDIILMVEHWTDLINSICLNAVDW